jgi:small nuclear ribonucleoprotein (snRNP)-like protein
MLQARRRRVRQPRDVCVEHTQLCANKCNSSTVQILMIHSSPQPPLPRHSCDPSSALDRLKRLLRQTLRVTISDTRIFIGTFAGTDQALNIILINTEEYRVGLEERPDGRYVGQVVIPWRLVTKVEGETREDDKYKLQAISEMYY